MIKSGAIIIEGHVQGLSNKQSLGDRGIPVYIIDKTNGIELSEYKINLLNL